MYEIRASTAECLLWRGGELTFSFFSTTIDTAHWPRPRPQISEGAHDDLISPPSWLTAPFPTLPGEHLPCWCWCWSALCPVVTLDRPLCLRQTMSLPFPLLDRSAIKTPSPHSKRPFEPLSIFFLFNSNFNSNCPFLLNRKPEMSDLRLPDQHENSLHDVIHRRPFRMGWDLTRHGSPWLG